MSIGEASPAGLGVQEDRPAVEWKSRKTWLAAWPAGVVALAFVPLVALHTRELGGRAHYQFYPLLVPGAVALLWRRCGRVGPLEPGDPGRTLWLGAAVWAALALSVLFTSPWAGAVSALASLLWAAYALGGGRLAVAALPAWGLLWLAIPPPRQLDSALVSNLQALVSGYSSRMLDLARVDHVMEGNVVEVAGRQLLVDQACSGIYSLFMLLLSTLFFALWTRMAWWRTALLMAAAAFWVVAGNVGRIVAIVVLSNRFGIDAVSGWRHEAIGILGFLMMLAMLACTNSLLNFVVFALRFARLMVLGTNRQVNLWGARRLLFDRRRVHRQQGSSRWHRKYGKSKSRRRSGRSSGHDEAGPDDGPGPLPLRLSGRVALGKTALPAPGRTWLGSPLAALAFGALLIPQSMLPGVNWDEVLADRGREVKAFGRLGADAMPAELAGFRRVDFATERRENGNTWGEHSRLWQYDAGAFTASVSLDYTFVGWHELVDCYTGQGWKLSGREEVPSPDGGGMTVKADFLNLEGRHGHLVFTLFDRRGRGLAPPRSRGPLEMMSERIAGWGLGRASAADPGGPTHQIQVFAVSATPLDPAQRARVASLFAAARGLIRSESIGSGGGKG